MYKMLYLLSLLHAIINLLYCLSSVFKMYSIQIDKVCYIFPSLSCMNLHSGYVQTTPAWYVQTIPSDMFHYLPLPCVSWLETSYSIYVQKSTPVWYVQRNLQFIHESLLGIFSHEFLSGMFRLQTRCLSSM